jgi:hypothetical protein
MSADRLPRGNAGPRVAALRVRTGGANLAEPFGIRGRKADLQKQPGRTRSMANNDSHKTSLMQQWHAYQPSKSTLVWACAATAAATMLIGFTWGGWMTGGASRGLAAGAGTAARIELTSAVCVDRFNAQADPVARLAEFKAIGSALARRQFVEAGGWATMPGQTAPETRGADACAVALNAA